jgi:hypothetical protein
MAQPRKKSDEIFTHLYERYLNEACEAKVSVRQRRSYRIAAYKCFGDMGDALVWAEKQMKQLQKKYKAVKMEVTNRTERQWRNALKRAKSHP